MFFNCFKNAIYLLNIARAHSDDACINLFIKKKKTKSPDKAYIKNLINNIYDEKHNVFKTYNIITFCRSRVLILYINF